MKLRLVIVIAIVITIVFSQAASAATYTDKDVNTLARLVWLEARGESDQGQRAVVEVVLNRVASDRFPNTIGEVVFANNGKVWQFSPARLIPKTVATSKEYRNVYYVLYGGERILPADVVYFSTTAAKGKQVYCKIGCHVFCRI